MTTFNLKTTSEISINYQNGLLPQRNLPGVFYQDTSCRSNLTNFSLSSENRRILRKTENFNYEFIDLKNFNYTPQVQKQIKDWIKDLGWDFPISSVKTIFTNHLFNKLYIWKIDSEIVAYSVCYFSNEISHVAYIFYKNDPSTIYFPVRSVLQATTDSHNSRLRYCYLGRFSPPLGYYKRTMPGFEYYQNGKWVKYTK